MRRVHNEHETRHHQVNSFACYEHYEQECVQLVLFGLCLFTQIYNCEQVAYITYLGYASWEWKYDATKFCFRTMSFLLTVFCRSLLLTYFLQHKNCMVIFKQIIFFVPSNKQVTSDTLAGYKKFAHRLYRRSYWLLIGCLK